MNKEVPWDQFGPNSGEKLPALKLKEKGNEANVEFLDEGKLVPKEQLEKPGQDYPARDSYVFKVKTLDKEHNWWVSANAFSVMNQLKELRVNDTLVGVKATIKRVATSAKETNYEIKRTW